MDRPNNGLGGSDIPVVVLGSQYGKNRIDLFNEKKGYVENNISGGDLDRGNALETTILTLSCPHIGAKAYESLDGSELTWSEDGLRYGHFDGFFYIKDRKELAECKAPRVSKAYAIEAGDYEALKGWYLQLQTYLELSDCTRGHLCIFNTDKWDPIVLTFDKDEEVCEKIRQYSKIFMDCIDNDILPTDDLFPNCDIKFPESGVIIKEATEAQVVYLEEIKLLKKGIALDKGIIDKHTKGLLNLWEDGVKKITYDGGSATIRMGKTRPTVTMRFKKEVKDE